MTLVSIDNTTQTESIRSVARRPNGLWLELSSYTAEGAPIIIHAKDTRLCQSLRRAAESQGSADGWISVGDAETYFKDHYTYAVQQELKDQVEVLRTAARNS